MKMLAFSLFYDAAKTAKKRLKQFYKLGRRNWRRCSQSLRTNQEQMRLKIDKKLKTASLN